MTSWDERYAGDDYLFGEAPNAFLARQAALLPATGRALAVADGEGRNGVWLAQHGMNVDSVDGSVPGRRALFRDVPSPEPLTVVVQVSGELRIAIEIDEPRAVPRVDEVPPGPVHGTAGGIGRLEQREQPVALDQVRIGGDEDVVAAGGNADPDTCAGRPVLEWGKARFKIGDERELAW